jgi:hypothetical protein
MTHDTFRTWWTLFMQRWDRAEHRELTAFYWAELHAMPDSEFEHAARMALRSCTFFPSVEEIEKLAGGKPKRSALGEWEKVVPLLRNSSSPLDSLDEPAKRAVRAMGGLSQIGRDVDGLPFRRAEFAELYDQFAADSAESIPELTEDGRQMIERAMRLHGGRAAS